MVEEIIPPDTRQYKCRNRKNMEKKGNRTLPKEFSNSLATRLIEKDIYKMLEKEFKIMTKGNSRRHEKTENSTKSEKYIF